MTDHVVLGAREARRTVFQLELADFGGFYERTYPVAFRTALGIVRDAALAADVTQEAYAAAFRNRDRFRGQVPAHAWLHRIVVNAAISALRHDRPIVREISVGDAPGHDATWMTAERLELFDALDALTPRHRAAVILRYYLDYDYATIARILDTTSTNVGAMLSRSLDRLRIELESPTAVAAGERGR